jgi:uncharacterized metal-binding protein YceD (DUF177 family)
VKNEFEAYDITIHGLENKTYEYDFEGQNDFFSHFEQEIIEAGSFKAHLILDKNATLLRLNLHIEADLDLICDRCLELFTEKIDINVKHIYKFGHDTQELDDEIDLIAFGTSKINIANLIFDYVMLQVPIKKLHPRFRGEVTDEEGVMVYQDDKIVEDVPEENLDPRWSALLNLKNKNQNN